MVKTASAVAPYDRPQDVNVLMTVFHPQAIQGLGNILLLNMTGSTTNTTPESNDAGKSQDSGSSSPSQKTPSAQAPSLPDTLSNQDRLNGLLFRKTDKTTGAIYREYANLDAVSVDYAEGTPVYNKASAYFAQDNHSDRIAILDFDQSKMLDALKSFWFFNWTFGVCVDNTITDATVKLANIFEANKNKFLVLQTDDLSKYTDFYGQNYTIGLKHDLSEAMDAAFVGNIACLPVGSITWKFKSLKGITAESLTTTELAGINRTHAIAYEEMMGKGQTSEGKTLSGEYIDLLHGVMWVQTTAEGRLENLLQSNGKIPYEEKGINMIVATLTQVMNEAYNRQIIMTNPATGRGMFSITATPRSQQSRDDLSNRHYGGISFNYHAASAVHTILVNGSVDSDTIMQA